MAYKICSIASLQVARLFKNKLIENNGLPPLFGGDRCRFQGMMETGMDS